MTTRIHLFMGDRYEETVAENVYPFAQYAIACTDDQQVVTLVEQVQQYPFARSIARVMKGRDATKITPIVIPQQLVNQYRDAMEAMCTFSQRGEL